MWCGDMLRRSLETSTMRIWKRVSAMVALILAASAALGGCASPNPGAGASEERPAPRYTRLPVR